MKQTKKSRTQRKRRQKENGQALQKTEQAISKDGAERISKAREIKPREQATSNASARRRSRPEAEERSRKLWERKQAELDARWQAARLRQAEEESARKRAMRNVYITAGIILAMLFCAFSWYFVHDFLADTAG